jgi:hypothetical protein
LSNLTQFKKEGVVDAVEAMDALEEKSYPTQAQPVKDHRYNGAFPVEDWEAAINPATSPERLKELAGDDLAEIRWRVARNPSTPLDVLEALSIDPVKEARMRAEEAFIERSNQ